MNSSYPQFEYSFWDSFSPAAQTVTRWIGYSFLGICLLALYFGLHPDGRSGFFYFLILIILASPFLLLPFLWKLIGFAKTHFIAEPNQLICYQSAFGLRFKRKVYEVTGSPQWALKLVRYTAEDSERKFAINVTDDCGERQMVQEVKRELMQELFVFLQAQYPQVNCVNQLVEQDELEFEATNKRAGQKFQRLVAGFAVFILLIILVPSGFKLKQDWHLYQDSQA